MWRAGHDPSLRMTVGIVMVLDHAPSLEALEERFAAVIKRSPRLQLRPGGESFGHTTPAWLEDDAPDASHHLRSAAVSRPGTLRQMLDLVSLLEAVPFDPDHAPWDGTLIEGLEGGRAALYLRRAPRRERRIGRAPHHRSVLRQQRDRPARTDRPPRRGGVGARPPIRRPDDRSDEGAPSAAARGERRTRSGDCRPGRARPRQLRFATVGDHRRLALAAAGRPLHDDPLRAHLGARRARRGPRARRQPERLARRRRRVRARAVPRTPRLPV